MKEAGLYDTERSTKAISLNSLRHPSQLPGGYEMICEECPRRTINERCPGWNECQGQWFNLGYHAEEDY